MFGLREITISYLVLLLFSIPFTDLYNNVTMLVMTILVKANMYSYIDFGNIPSIMLTFFWKTEISSCAHYKQVNIMYAFSYFER